MAVCDPGATAAYRSATLAKAAAPSAAARAATAAAAAGAKAAQILLREDVLPTGVVMANDHAAVGLIHSLLRAGVRVPEDLSVTGFDDSRIAQLSYVDLTTVRQDGAQMAQAAVAAALSRINGRREPIESVIEPTLIIRGTTAAPREAAQILGRVSA